MNQSIRVNNKQGPYVQVNGLRMYYESHGDGEPVILLHGGLETCQMWAPAVPVLSGKYLVITPDSRAHGRTDNPSGCFNYPLMAEDIAQLIQTLGLKQPIVVGYSDGGQTALVMAMVYPGLARGYMLGGIFNEMTPGWRGVMQEHLGFKGPGVVDFERVAQTNPQLIQSLQEKHGDFHAPDYWKSLLEQVSLCWWNGPAHTEADFARIVDPVIFWCGDRDVFCPPEQSLAMYRMVKEAELAVIPNADHFSITQHWVIVTDLLLNFLDRTAINQSVQRR